MTWEKPTVTSPPEGVYVVKAESIFKSINRINVFECRVSYTKDEKGKIKQHWHCNNQKVILWLKEV